MTHYVDDIDEHMAAAGTIERAALVPGMFLAWCVNLQLVSAEFTAAFERDLLRVRYRDMTPGAFFIKVTGGRLDTAVLSQRGRLFAEHYYSTYREQTSGGAGATALYDANDDWDTYDSIAPELTRAYYAFADAGHKLARTDKQWWQVWR
jgi:hypothetical protein